jgi:hypothetical protein
MILKDPTDARTIKNHNVYTHPCVLFRLPHEDLHFTKRITIFSFYDPYNFNQAMSTMGDHEFTFSNYPNIYLPSLHDICHLCIRIIHIFVFSSVSPIIFIHKYIFQ